MHSPEAISGEQDGGGFDMLAKMPDFHEFRASNSKDGSSNSETESGQEQKSKKLLIIWWCFLTKIAQSNKLWTG